MVYLDNSATTRVCEEAISRMTVSMAEDYGNPSSLHSFGIAAQRAVMQARREIATLLGTKPEQITFVSGGTEANNTAIFGAARVKERRAHVAVTTAIEHPSVSACFDELERRGWTVTRVQPLADGRITPDMIQAACTAETSLVSVMTVNNETGAYMDIPSMVARVRRVSPDALFHTDAVQAVGKVVVRPERWGVDLLSLSGHKLHGPKGIGALYIRKGVRMVPYLHGGGQEHGLRSGTEPVPAIVGLGAAAAAVPSIAEQNHTYEALKAHLQHTLSSLENIRWHLPPNGVPYIVNFSLMGYRSETVLNFLAERGIFVSSGSACAKGQHSTVLTAMGLPEAEIDSSLRISFCRDTTVADIDALGRALHEAVSTLQRRQK